MSEKICVLEVLEATVGGTRRHLVSLVNEIDRSKFTVEVAAPPIREGTIDDTRFVEEIEATGTPIHFVDMCREIRPFQDFKSFLRLYKLIRDGNYDVVHLHSSKAGFIGRIAAKLNGIPTVYTPNGFYFLDARNPIKGRFFLCLEKVAGLFTDILITVSNSERESVVENKIISLNRLITIPNSIDSTLFQYDFFVRNQIRKELGIANDTFVIGTVSRFIPQKDPFTLVRTAKIVIEKIPDVRFIWCGEGEMRKVTENLAQELNIYDSFYFLGFRSDIHQVMCSFDLFLLTSVFEGLPYTLLEVISLGLPVVATNVVGTKDIVKNNVSGYLEDAGDYCSLADAVIKLVQDDKICRQFGKAGQQVVQTQYNLNKMVEDICTVYESLAIKHATKSMMIQK